MQKIDTIKIKNVDGLKYLQKKFTSVKLTTAKTL